MKVLAIGNVVKPVTTEQRDQVMPKEIVPTMQLYLDGAIEQFWFRTDKPGVFFLMNVDSIEQAKEKMSKLPLVTMGVVEYDYVPVGPLAAIGYLLAGK